MLLFVPLPKATLWWREAINCGHILVFIFLPVLIVPWLQQSMPKAERYTVYLIVVGISLVLGALIEGLQTFVGREASLHDMAGNVIGTVAGLLLYTAFDQNRVIRRRLLEVVLVVAAIGVLLAGLSPLLRLSWHYLERENAFPVVMDFTADWADSFVQYDEGQYPGVTIIEPKADWSDYKTLDFSVMSSAQRPVRLVIRVHDRAHDQSFDDRFNRRLIAKPGKNNYRIPLAEIRDGPVHRQLDLHHVAGLTVFTTSQDDWAQLGVGSIVLD